jgi:magnesium-transporting ATPase (P-type)
MGSFPKTRALSVFNTDGWRKQEWIVVTLSLIAMILTVLFYKKSQNPTPEEEQFTEVQIKWILVASFLISMFVNVLMIHCVLNGRCEALSWVLVVLNSLNMGALIMGIILK